MAELLRRLWPLCCQVGNHPKGRLLAAHCGHAPSEEGDRPLAELRDKCRQAATKRILTGGQPQRYVCFHANRCLVLQPPPRLVGGSRHFSAEAQGSL